MELATYKFKMGWLDRLSLATYRSAMGYVRPPLGLHVGNPTKVCWTEFGAVGCQHTTLKPVHNHLEEPVVWVPSGAVMSGQELNGPALWL